jgi:hypothetical protein
MNSSDLGQPGPAPIEWGLTSESRVWVAGHNARTKAEVDNLLSGAVRPPTGPVDIAFIVPDSVGEAEYFASKVRPRLTPEGSLWVVLSASTALDAGVVEAVSGVGFSESDRAELDARFMSIGFRQRGDTDTPGH